MHAGVGGVQAPHRPLQHVPVTRHQHCHECHDVTMSRQQWCSRSELRLRTIVMDTRHMRHPADPHPAWCTTFMTRPPVQLSMAATMNVVSLSPCPPICCARGIKPSLCRPGSSRHTPVVWWWRGLVPGSGSVISSG